MRQSTCRDLARLLAGGLCIALALQTSEAEEPSNGQAAFTFGVVTDAQYCDAEPGGTRYYRASTKKLAECVGAFNKMDLAFAIHLGDFIDRHASSYDAMTPIYDRLVPPRYHVLGNHEFSVAADKVAEVPAMLGLRDRYYSFRSHGWRFIVLDGNDLSLIARPKGSRKYEEALALYTTLKERNAPNAQTWNGAVGKKQFAWLDRQLDEADEAEERAIVFCHFPVFPKDPHNLWNDRQIVQLLESHSCVAAFMNGHNHAGNYGEQGGVHYLTFPGMVETRDTTAYAVVHVHPDSLRIVGYGRTPNRLLTIRE